MRHRSLVLVPCVATLFAASVSTSALGQSATLRLNLKPGASYSFTSSNKMTTEGAGQMSAMGNISQTMAMTIKVLKRTAQENTVQMKVTSVKFNLPPNSPMAGNMTNAAKQIEGTTIEQVLSPLAKAISSKVVGGGMAAQQFLAQFGAMRTGFLGVEFPQAAVQPGSKWSTSIDFAKVMGSAAPGMLQMGKNSKVPIQYTLSKLETRGARRVALIQFTMAGSMDMQVGGGAPMASPGGGASGGAQRMPMKLVLDTRGTIEVDLATGMPFKGTSSGHTKTTVMGMNIVQKMSSQFSVK